MVQTKFSLPPVVALCSLLFTALAHSDTLSHTYASVGAGLIYVDTPSGRASPPLAGLRLGRAIDLQHHFELALMRSVREDEVNQLDVEVPSVVSLLWRYTPEQESTLKVQGILGVSDVEVDADYAGLASSSEHYTGVSYGVGFEEYFKSVPGLRVSADLVQFYRGDELDIYSVSLGLAYDF